MLAVVSAVLRVHAVAGYDSSSSSSVLLHIYGCLLCSQSGALSSSVYKRNICWIQQITSAKEQDLQCMPAAH
jgi:hypothetical protein